MILHFRIAKGRGIAIPTDLESQVACMFNKAAMLTRQTSKWLQATKQPKIERSQSQVRIEQPQNREFTTSIIKFIDVLVDAA